GQRPTRVVVTKGHGFGAKSAGSGVGGGGDRAIDVVGGSGGPSAGESSFAGRDRDGGTEGPVAVVVAGDRGGVGVAGGIPVRGGRPVCAGRGAGQVLAQLDGLGLGVGNDGGRDAALRWGDRGSVAVIGGGRLPLQSVGGPQLVCGLAPEGVVAVAVLVGDKRVA